MGAAAYRGWLPGATMCAAGGAAPRFIFASPTASRGPGPFSNVLPMMRTGSLFGAQSDTIMSGVVYLWHSGSWHIALVVFIASIVVPLAKMLSLTYLLITVQLGWTTRSLERTKLYRILEFVGPWSMLDVYVVLILVALVQLKGLASIQPGLAVAAFGAVVVLTMFAAMAFDPRLLWEPKERHHV
jgi:paraquat-inducible protein A